MLTNRIFTRRHLLQTLGASAVAVATGGVARAQSAPAPACLPATNLTRGPFFVDTLNDPNLRDGMQAIDLLIPQRSDVRSDSQGRTGEQPGARLNLTLHVNNLSTGGCQPLPNARVDLWHCNAQGVYSDVQSPMNDQGADHTGDDSLRGFQMTDAQGKVTFTSVVPGWYMGRTVHMHVKVRLLQGDVVTTEATTQLFFHDAQCTDIFARNLAYRVGDRRTFNEQDGIFLEESPKLLLDLHGDDAAGYSAALSIAIRRGTQYGG